MKSFLDLAQALESLTRAPKPFATTTIISAIPALFIFAAAVSFSVAPFIIINAAHAQTIDPALVPGVNPASLEGSVLEDRNGNGVLEIAAFGDSITRGVGDFTGPAEEVFTPTHPEDSGNEAGYPLRLEGFLKTGVFNLGDPGEILASDGLLRFARVIRGGAHDLVIVSGGANDALRGITDAEYYRSVQTMLNIAYAQNVSPILWTTPRPCCNHSHLSGRIDRFNQILVNLSIINEIPLGRAAHGFSTTCTGSECSLLNLPEGLHPNTVGYDVITETILAALLQIDLFVADGAAQLEQALNLPAGSVQTKPDPVEASTS